MPSLDFLNNIFTVLGSAAGFIGAVWAGFIGIRSFIDKRKEKKKEARKQFIAEVKHEVFEAVKTHLIEIVIEDTKNSIKNLKSELDKCGEEMREKLEKEVTDQNEEQSKDLNKEIDRIKDSLDDTLKILQEYAMSKVGMDFTLAHFNEKMIKAQSDISVIQNQIIEIEKSIIKIKIIKGVDDGS